MKHVASFDGKANEQFSRLGSPRKLEHRTTSGLPFAIALAVLVLFASRVLLGQTDPFLGTWKLNASKSKFVPGPPKKSETRMIASTNTFLTWATKSIASSAKGPTGQTQSRLTSQPPEELTELRGFQVIRGQKGADSERAHEKHKIANLISSNSGVYNISVAV